MGIVILVAAVIMAFMLREIFSEISGLEKINNRYSFLDVKHSSITYTYNRTSRAVELNGAVEQILGKELVGLASVNLMSHGDRFHD